jgi:hypothetical protein
MGFPFYCDSVERVCPLCSRVTGAVYGEFKVCVLCARDCANAYEFQHSGKFYRQFCTDEQWQWQERRNKESASKKPKIPLSIRLKVFTRDGGKCLCCGAQDNLHCGHIVAHSKGGSIDLENLQTLCRSCNSKMGTKTIDYRRINEFT